MELRSRLVLGVGYEPNARCEAVQSSWLAKVELDCEPNSNSVCKPYKIHLEEIKNMQLFLIRHSPVPRHQIFSVCPVALSKNRVWTLSL